MRKTAILVFATIICGLLASVSTQAQVVNGTQWHDQDGSPVSAHGANIVYDQGKYWLFGEYKTDSANVFAGFSCYSSTDLQQWRFERIVFRTQKDGRMGPQRVGERPKVLRCPKTGEYVMLMHSDNMRYKDPCTAYATSKTINGEYTFQGPILYKDKPIRKWDIGSFVDDDGRAYLLTNHGGIWRLSEDFHSIDSCMMNGLPGTGESPTIFKYDGIYFWLSSHTTSWERNDNMYFTATSLSGPWTPQGEFCPKGSLTWNSQCSFTLPMPWGVMYMGDRWSFPRQQTAATYVWLPMTVSGTRLTIPEYWQTWNPLTGKREELSLRKVAEGWTGSKPGDSHTITFSGQQVAISGITDEQSAYADLVITDSRGNKMVETSIDFYSKVRCEDIRYVSPRMPQGTYTLTITVSPMKPNWSDKRKSDYGSKGYEVKVTQFSEVK